MYVVNYKIVSFVTVAANSACVPAKAIAKERIGRRVIDGITTSIERLNACSE